MILSNQLMVIGRSSSSLISKPSTVISQLIRSIRTLSPLPTTAAATTTTLSPSSAILLSSLNRLFSSSSSTSWKSIPKSKAMRIKLRTHSGASKRFFLNGNGQFKRCQSGKQHLMLNKSNRNKRDLKPMVLISSRTQTRLLRRLLPYCGKRAGFRRIDIRECVWFKSGRFQGIGDSLRSAIIRAKENA